MKKPEFSELPFELVVSRIYHSINKIKQKELTNKYHIAPRQLYILHIIHSLGPKATVGQVASIVDRDVHVIGRSVAYLEMQGLIERSKESPKTRILNLKLSQKGIDMIKISPNSKSINAILSSISAKDYQQMQTTLYSILVKLKEYTPSSHNEEALKLLRDLDSK
jgi:DNA-binding MarR family transcriptional regulator